MLFDYSKRLNKVLQIDNLNYCDLIGQGVWLNFFLCSFLHACFAIYVINPLNPYPLITSGYKK